MKAKTKTIDATLQIIKPEEYGMQVEKANDLLGNLPQLKSERSLLEAEYNSVILLDIEDPATAKKAKELRLLIKDNRTKGVEVWHKTTKEFFLKGGQFVDAIKKMEIAVNTNMETKLEAIEKHAENKEIERKKLLADERVKQVEIYSEFIPFGVSWGDLSEEQFKLYKDGAKLQYDAKAKADAEAEKKREADEKKQADEAEAQRKENARLKAEKAEKDKKIADQQKVIDAQNKAKADAEKKKAEADAKAKKEADKLAKAPIKKQLTVWVDSFSIDRPNGELLNHETSLSIEMKFDAFKKWAKSEIENI